MHLFRTVTAAAVLAASSTFALDRAEALECSNVELISAWGAGGGTDTFLRNIAKPLSAELGVPVKVINMEGSMGEIARQQLISRPADGCSLVSVDPDTITTAVDGTTSITLKEHLVPVFRGHVDIGFLHARAGAFGSWDEMVAWAKENPGKLKVGGAGAVGTDRTALETTLAEAGVSDFIYVPYNSTGEMHADLLGGRLDGMYDEMGSVMAMVEGEKIEPLIVFNETRIEQFPDVPAAGELGYEITPSNWRGLAAHADTPDAIVQELSDALMAASKDEDYARYENERLLDLKADGKLGAAAFAEAIAEERALKEAQHAAQGG
ncbi:tripartite tricarboxylate transporter substrate binding protein [Aquibium sp. A9E412]|uniref:tripartite tricarboxylate transporter substrate binding protein n=1 Tax=Aquibium sp. A9E412 TaxID=2976767 RepID=UPI0025B05354|nr:tripartite tricarboxylate transporter substrate binding protein [Aquibium sp. A9E412]MDN2565595.1 tripartite tricarboxylate transporter substrate binding protein [Aquibium sp. A9E412]